MCLENLFNKKTVDKDEKQNDEKTSRSTKETRNSRFIFFFIQASTSQAEECISKSWNTFTLPGRMLIKIWIIPHEQNIMLSCIAWLVSLKGSTQPCRTGWCKTSTLTIAVKSLWIIQADCHNSRLCSKSSILFFFFTPFSTHPSRATGPDPQRSYFCCVTASP